MILTDTISTYSPAMFYLTSTVNTIQAGESNYESLNMLKNAESFDSYFAPGKEPATAVLNMMKNLDYNKTLYIRVISRNTGEKRYDYTVKVAVGDPFAGFDTTEMTFTKQYR